MKSNLKTLAGVILILVLVGVYLFFPRGGGHYTNLNIPSELLYQSEQESLPMNKFIEPVMTGGMYLSGQMYDTDLLYQEDGVFYCKQSLDKARIIEYFHYSPPQAPLFMISGGWGYRYALVCGDNYWIVDGRDSLGERLFGPFQAAPIKK